MFIIHCQSRYHTKTLPVWNVGLTVHTWKDTVRHLWASTRTATNVRPSKSFPTQEIQRTRTHKLPSWDKISKRALKRFSRKAVVTFFGIINGLLRIPCFSKRWKEVDTIMVSWLLSPLLTSFRKNSYWMKYPHIPLCPRPSSSPLSASTLLTSEITEIRRTLVSLFHINISIFEHHWVPI